MFVRCKAARTVTHMPFAQPLLKGQKLSVFFLSLFFFLCVCVLCLMFAWFALHYRERTIVFDGLCLSGVSWCQFAYVFAWFVAVLLQRLAWKILLLSGLGFWVGCGCSGQFSVEYLSLWMFMFGSSVFNAVLPMFFVSLSAWSPPKCIRKVLFTSGFGLELRSGF